MIVLFISLFFATKIVKDRFLLGKEDVSLEVVLISKQYLSHQVRTGPNQTYAERRQQ